MIDKFAQLIADRLINNSLVTCSRWAEHKIWTPEPHFGPLSFEKFPWQKDIIDCQEPQVTVQKCSQSGFSVAGLIKTLFMVDQVRTDVLYVLPTANLAGDFAKARLDQMVAISPELANLFVGTNNVGLKTTSHRSNIFIRGSVAESGLVSLPVGTAVVDEWDRCNQNALALVHKRMSAYVNKHLFVLSTPTLPEHGINVQYLLGTQEQFVFPCIGCGRIIQLIWPDNIEICGESSTDPDCHLSYLKCDKCGVKLPHETKTEWLSKASWEAMAVAHGHRSFHLNQMYAWAMTPGELVVDYFKGESSEAAKVEFTNQILGKPHLIDGARVTDTIIDSCLGSHKTDDPRPEDSSRMIVMGVDIGMYLDIAIAEYLYDQDPGYEPYIHSTCKLLTTLRLPGSDFDVLDRVMAEWQVQYACLDFQPETVLAKAFCRRFYGYSAVVQYRRGTVGNEIKEVMDDNKVPTLTVDRTSFLDMSLGRLHKQKIILPSNISPVFRDHVKALARTYELDEFGRPRAVYVTLNNRSDHLAHALTLTEVAHFRSYSKATVRSIKPSESIHNF